MRRTRSLITAEQRAWIQDGMTQLGAVTEDELIRILEDPGRVTKDRALACSLVGLSRSRNALPTLLRVGMSTSDVLLESEAFAAIGMIRSKRLTRPLLQLIKDGVPIQKKRAVVFALGFLNDRRSIHKLIGRLLDENEDWEIRSFAGEALGMLPPRRRSVKALINALSDKCIDVRYSALCAVETLRIMEAAPEIAKLLADGGSVDGVETVGDRALNALALIQSEKQQGGKRPSRL